MGMFRPCLPSYLLRGQNGDGVLGGDGGVVRVHLDLVLLPFQRPPEGLINAN